MAKKAKKSARKRARLTAGEKRVRERPHEKPVPVTLVPPEGESHTIPAEAPPSPGKVSVATDIPVPMVFTSPSKGVRIDLDHLGIGHDADSVMEISGNFKYLDSARPPVIEGGDLLVFFDPELTIGTWNFVFRFTWDEEMETVTPKPLKDGKYDGVIEPKRKTRKKR